MRKIIIGDVHGCYKELLALLDAVRFKKQDELIFVGDLIDKGPCSVEVVRHVKNLSELFRVVVVRGNHEEKLLRWSEKPHSAPPETQEMLQSLGDELLGWLKLSVISYHLPQHNTVVLHGGVLPDWDSIPTHKEFGLLEASKKREAARMMRVRYIRGRDRILRECRLYDASGCRVGVFYVDEGEPLPEVPVGGRRTVKEYLKKKGEFLPFGEEREEDIFWAQAYDGRFGHIIFGHEPFIKETSPRIFFYSTGVDLGCVCGGRLAAVILGDGSLRAISVPSSMQLSSRVMGEH